MLFEVKNEQKTILIQTVRTYALLARETGERCYLDLARKTLTELKNWLREWENDRTQEFRMVG